MASPLRVPTFSQQLAVVRARLLKYNKDISTVPGSVAGDLLVNSQAESDVQQMALTYYTMVSYSPSELLALKSNTTMLTLIATALNITNDALLAKISDQIDSRAKDFGLTRLAAQKAVGSITLLRVDPPTSNITIPVGKTVKTSAGTDIVTTTEVTMYSSVAASYYNTTYQRYAIEVPAEAVLAGSAGNAPVGTVTRIATPISGFPEVTNLNVITGGTDKETDEALVARILARWQAIGRTTKAGLELSIRDSFPLADLYIATSGDAYAMRGIGRTDIYAKGTVEEVVTEVYTGYNSSLFSDGIRLNKQPAYRLDSVSSGVASMREDTTTALAGSVRAQGTVRFSTPPTFPVTISYARNRNVEDIQAVFNEDDTAPANQQDPTTDLIATQTPLLVKEAPDLPVDYAASITVVPGYIKANVIAAVQVAIASYSATLSIGQTIYLSDVNEIVEGVEGVLRLNGTPTKFAPSTQSGVQNSITPNANAYAVFSSVVIS